MFINKWLVSESIGRLKERKVNTGVCLSLDGRPISNIDLFKTIQSHLIQAPFTILLSGENFVQQDTNDSLAETMIRLFFQPGYYKTNYQPVLFLRQQNPAVRTFLSILADKCNKQGLKDILVLEVGIAPFTQVITDTGKTDLGSLISNWKSEFLSGKNPPEINLLVSEKSENEKAVLSGLETEQAGLEGSEEYAAAVFLYRKQKEIEELTNQLYLKAASEKNTQLYLSVQKEERANGLKWYYYEYEILPIWYKKFGHVLKVIMGKRSFKSLFSDKVKKYKD